MKSAQWQSPGYGFTFNLEPDLFVRFVAVAAVVVVSAAVMLVVQNTVVTELFASIIPGM